MVGAWRFELQTSCAQGRRATRLRYAPTVQCAIHSKVLLKFPATAKAVLFARPVVLRRPRFESWQLRFGLPRWR
jgi:hypothetical protein